MEENKITIYQTEDGQTQIDVRLENETVWLTQAQMAVLFQKDRTVITRHINNVFKEGELEKEQVCAKFAHTTQHGSMAVLQTFPQPLGLRISHLPVLFSPRIKQIKQIFCSSQSKYISRIKRTLRNNTLRNYKSLYYIRPDCKSGRTR